MELSRAPRPDKDGVVPPRPPRRRLQAAPRRDHTRRSLLIVLSSNCARFYLLSWPPQWPGRGPGWND
eukprot:1230857-Pyramimonas_sp.AAC.1